MLDNCPDEDTIERLFMAHFEALTPAGQMELLEAQLDIVKETFVRVDKELLETKKNGRDHS